MAVATNCKNTGRSSRNCQRNPDGVPCPFCGLSDTKFKFLNNRKVDQPRYQCLNCERYWTEGGRIRGMYKGKEEEQNPVAADTTSQPPSVSAVSTPTPTASDGSSMEGVTNVSPLDVLVEVAKWYWEKDFPHLI